jgi:hypothetical protein
VAGGSNSGRKTVVKNDQVKAVPPSEFEQYLVEGWLPGIARSLRKLISPNGALIKRHKDLILSYLEQGYLLDSANIVLDKPGLKKSKIKIQFTSEEPLATKKSHQEKILSLISAGWVLLKY